MLDYEMWWKRRQSSQSNLEVGKIGPQNLNGQRKKFKSASGNINH
jgi:hypothetical protein